MSTLNSFRSSCQRLEWICGTNPRNLFYRNNAQTKGASPSGATFFLSPRTERDSVLGTAHLGHSNAALMEFEYLSERVFYERFAPLELPKRCISRSCPTALSHVSSHHAHRRSETRFVTVSRAR